MMLFIKTISFTEMPLKFVNPRKRKSLNNFETLFQQVIFDNLGGTNN